ncbi:MAG TPA: signal peptidase I [Anaerolineales bacterium]|nr:signal peptidase I [Anaerolineales bacterium]
MLPKTFTQTPLASVLLAGMATAWIVLAPIQFGGQAAYVMVAGASMEPTLHQGDLVVVRESQTYGVGDVATYRNPSVGPVIHRIVDRQGDRFVFQGDNNDWLDSYSPTASEIVGKAWLVLPGGASVLRQLRSPLGLVLLAMSFAFILIMTVRNTGRRRRPAEDHVRSVPAPRAEHGLATLDGPIFVVATVGLGTLILALVAFTRPTTLTVPDDIPYTHLGRFSYQAEGPASVYAGADVDSGDPVFHQLVPEFQIDFTYDFQASVPADLSARAGMLLEISEPSGWARSILLQPESTFSETKVTLTGVVDLGFVRRVIGIMEERTGVDRQAYWVDVIPWVKVEGAMGGEPFSDTFRPSLSFTLDDLELYIRQGDPLSQSDPLRPTSSGYAARISVVPAVLSILGIDLTVAAARWIGGLGTLICLAAIGYLGAPILRAYREGGLERIRAEYADGVIDVKEAPQAAAKSVIELVSFEDLARLAERRGHMILHMSENGDEHYYVEDAGRTYHVGPARVRPGVRRRTAG